MHFNLFCIYININKNYIFKKKIKYHFTTIILSKPSIDMSLCFILGLTLNDVEQTSTPTCIVNKPRNDTIIFTAFYLTSTVIGNISKNFA